MPEVTPSFPEAIWDGFSTGNNFRATIHDQINPDSEDFDRLAAEIKAVQTAVGVSSGAASVGAASAGAASVVETSNGIIHKTVITLEDFSVDTVDADTAGAHGSRVLYTFPAGVIQVLGGTSDLTVLKVGASIDVDAALVTSVGSTATVNDNATLTTVEADMIPSASTTLADSAGTSKGKSTAATMAAGVFDGTSSAVNARLNVAVAAADHGASAAAVEYSGTVTITWINHGDN